MRRREFKRVQILERTMSEHFRPDVERWVFGNYPELAPLLLFWQATDEALKLKKVRVSKTNT
jgi:hypothetical protein